MADGFIIVDESTTTDRRIDTERLTVGANEVDRERIQVSGTAAGQIAPVSSVTGLMVEVSSGSSQTVNLVAGSSIEVSLAAGSTLAATIAGNSTAIISTVSAIRVKSTANQTVALAAGSSLVASLTAGTTLAATISGNSTAVISTGIVRVIGDVSRVTAGSTALTVQYANISLTTAVTGQTIVSSGNNQTIRVLAWNVVCPTTTVLTWFSGSTDGSTLAGPYSFAANGGISVGYSPVGHFETAADVDLVLKSASTSLVGGNIVYVQSSAI